MFIDFYSIHSINNGKVIIGYTEYFQNTFIFSKYFHIINNDYFLR